VVVAAAAAASRPSRTRLSRLTSILPEVVSHPMRTRPLFVAGRERAFTTNSLAVTRKQEEESLRLRAEYRRQRAVTSIPERSLGEKLVGGIRAVFGRN
jgi:hypothetical protein